MSLTAKGNGGESARGRSRHGGGGGGEGGRIGSGGK